MSSADRIASPHPRPPVYRWEGLSSHSNRSQAGDSSGYLSETDATTEAGSLSASVTPLLDLASSPDLRPGRVTLSASTTPVLKGSEGNLSARLTAARMTRLFLDGGFVLDEKTQEASLGKRVSLLDKTWDSASKACSAAEAALQGAAPKHEDLEESPEDVINNLYKNYPSLSDSKRELNKGEGRGDFHVRSGIDVGVQLEAWRNQTSLDQRPKTAPKSEASESSPLETVRNELYRAHPRLSVLERERNSEEGRGDLHIQPGIDVSAQLKTWLNPASAVNPQPARATDKELHEALLRQIHIRQSERTISGPKSREELRLRREQEGLPLISDKEMDSIVEYFRIKALAESQ